MERCQNNSGCLNHDEQTGTLVVVSSISCSVLSSHHAIERPMTGKLALDDRCTAGTGLPSRSSACAPVGAGRNSVGSRTSRYMFVHRYSLLCKVVGCLERAKPKAAIASEEALRETTCTHAILSRLERP